jgi:hypothetical protein
VLNKFIAFEHKKTGTKIETKHVQSRSIKAILSGGNSDDEDLEDKMPSEITTIEKCKCMNMMIEE